MTGFAHDMTIRKSFQVMGVIKTDGASLRYPELVREVVGQGLDDFKFLACSGDRSVQIYDQVLKMDSDTDMVIMTAGGNDLCLVSRHPIDVDRPVLRMVRRHQ